MAIKFGDSLENQNSNYPIVDLIGNHAKGIIYVSSWDNAALQAIPNAKRGQGVVAIVTTSGAAYVYMGTAITNGTFGTITDPNWVPLGEATQGTGLTVQIPVGRSFGKYIQNDTIPATGWNALEIIRDAITGYTDPTVTAGGSLTTAAFQTVSFTPSHTVTFNVKNNNRNSITTGNNYKIASVELYRAYRSSASTNIADFTLVGDFTASLTELNTQGVPGTGTNFSYTHATATTAGSNNDFYYAVKVVAYDGSGVAQTPVYIYNSGSLTITVNNYAAPTVAQTNNFQTRVASSTTVTNESNNLRELGNQGTTIAGTITRNSPNVALTGYKVQKSVNGGAWADVAGQTYTITGNPEEHTLTTANIDTTPTSANTTTSIQYRILVTDAFNTTYTTPAATSTGSTISFQSAFIVGKSSTPITGTIDSDLINGLLGTGNVFKQLRTAWSGHGTIAPSNQSDNPATYVYLAYPATVADITSITQGALIVTGGFTKETTPSADISRTNSFNATINYKVYVSNAPNSFDGTALTII